MITLRQWFYNQIFYSMATVLLIIICLGFYERYQLIKEINYIHFRIDQTHNIMYCTRVLSPCRKCGNVIFNALQYGGKSYDFQYICAKCGEPDKYSEDQFINNMKNFKYLK